MVKEFYIKNMVCDRCIKVLQNEIKAINVTVLEIELGKLKVDIKNPKDETVLKSIIFENGFSLVESPEEQLVEQVKIELIRLLKELPLEMPKRLSAHLEDKLNIEYSKISKVFSYSEEVTIEKYFIKLKIEKVKELIQIKENNFTEMGHLLNYSHINHLSSQFKNETGMSLSQYKQQQLNFRTSLDKIV
ncbi:MAG: helix-turn-helix domain-containing protein [Flavobacteriales bacterium]|tara:strand:- start:5285 stop:5851 length:567 start_codon:yes stop_codon:yes gene_type:complete